MLFQRSCRPDQTTHYQTGQKLPRLTHIKKGTILSAPLPHLYPLI